MTVSVNFEGFPWFCVIIHEKLSGRVVKMKAELIALLDELSSTGGNYNTTALIAIRRKFMNFLSQDEYLLHYENDENMLIAKDALHFIDAYNTYAVTNDRVESSKHLQFFFKRLIDAEKWNYYELAFLVSSLNITESTKQALVLIDKAYKMIDIFKADVRSELIEGHLATNVLSVLLGARFSGDHGGIHLESEFDRWFFKLEMLAEKNTELKILLDTSEIRQAVFNLNSRLMNQLFQKFESSYDEKIVKALGKEVDAYIASKKYTELYSEHLESLS